MLTLDEGIDVVLDYMMVRLKDGHCEIELAMDELYPECIPELGLGCISDKDHNKIMNYSLSIWTKKFKAKFGFTDEEYLDQYQKMIRASLAEAERKVVEDIEKYCCGNIRFDINGKVGGEFWYSTPLCIIYEPSTYATGIRFRDVAEYGLQNITEIEDFLGRIGATKRKRPKTSRRYVTSLYD